jgi:hypothetical protein
MHNKLHNKLPGTEFTGSLSPIVVTTITRPLLGLTASCRHALDQSSTAPKDNGCFATADLVVSIVGRAVLLLAVPAVTLGWVLQAFVVMLWSMAQSKPFGISTDPRESFLLPEVRK